MKNNVIIFDLDGTLINTDTLIRQSFEFVFKKYKPGYELGDEEFLTFLGPSLKATFSRYFEEDLLDELVEYYNVHNLAHHEDYVTIYPTVIETLEFLKEKGYKLAVLTTKRQRAAMLGIRMFDLEKYFDVIICGDQLEKQKPDPEGIYKILSALKCDKAVMVGDNPSDIYAGKNANVYSVGVKWTPKGEDSLNACHPDYMLNEMKDLIQFVEGVK